MKPEKNYHCPSNQPQLVFKSYFIGLNSAALKHPRKRAACYFDCCTGYKEIFCYWVIADMHSCDLLRHMYITRDYLQTECTHIILNGEERIHEITPGCSS